MAATPSATRPLTGLSGDGDSDGNGRGAVEIELLAGTATPADAATSATTTSAGDTAEPGAAQAGATSTPRAAAASPTNSSVVVPLSVGSESAATTTVAAPAATEPAVGPPAISLWDLFVRFLGYGVRAWGGPFAQIAMIKQELVDQERWISTATFNRVLAVYQALPGPEATELCCYMGMVARGRVGSVLAGLGFILPGLCLMLLFSYIYDNFVDVDRFRASFTAMEPAVLAMVFRAVHRLTDTALIAQDHGHGPGHGHGSGTGTPAASAAAKTGVAAWDAHLTSLAALACLASVAELNFFITLLLCGLLHGFVYSWGKLWVNAVAVVALIVAWTLVLVYVGVPEDLSLGVGIGDKGPTPENTFVVGLLGGLLTFGGAYTAIPFIQYETVTLGRWLTNDKFLNGLALGAVLPSPLVIFVAYVGFIARGIDGALLMTLGMFLPAFSFTLIGHELFEKIVNGPPVIARFLDGVTAGVLGLIVVTALQLLRTTVTTTLDVVIFLVSLHFMYTNKHKLGPIILVAVAAFAGQVLFVDDDNRFGAGNEDGAGTGAAVDGNGTDLAL